MSGQPFIIRLESDCGMVLPTFDPVEFDLCQVAVRAAVHFPQSSVARCPSVDERSQDDFPLSAIQPITPNQHGLPTFPLSGLMVSGA